jgi:hypothetical protein
MGVRIAALPRPCLACWGPTVENTADVGKLALPRWFVELKNLPEPKTRSTTRQDRLLIPMPFRL